MTDLYPLGSAGAENRPNHDGADTRIHRLPWSERTVLDGQSEVRRLLINAPMRRAPSAPSRRDEDRLGVSSNAVAAALQLCAPRRLT
jgi:hypothetical protein